MSGNAEVVIGIGSDGIKPVPVPPMSWISCVNGHRVCFCADGIVPGDTNWTSRLSDWQQRPRKTGEPFAQALSCDECGEPWSIVLPEAAKQWKEQVA
jgi:hypothetical protein